MVGPKFGFLYEPSTEADVVVLFGSLMPHIGEFLEELGLITPTPKGGAQNQQSPLYQPSRPDLNVIKALLAQAPCCESGIGNLSLEGSTE
jgi:hypothetical protein